MAERGRGHRHDKGRRGGDQQKKHRVKRSDVEDNEVKRLEAVIAEQKPASGTNPLSLTEDVSSAGYAAARSFEDLPLSRYTKEGLAVNKFETLTAIQRAALPHALAGRDILGAAKTGSGKTLAFLIPLVERLYRARWTRLDGLGGLVLTPTRELALQIFLELRKIGKSHDLSAGLLIGGKNVKEEQAAINRMNILVATPGRLLQHMDETPGFDASNLQVLVLDEADRLLDMGFAATLDAILESLPQDRQTMLFSATQTKSVKDLARLSLSDPEYLSVHETSETATPLKLQQAVAVVPAEAKMDTLWSFIRTHLASKTIVFLSTCKQVRFVHEAFRKLRPGVPLRALHGGMKQMKRMAVFQDFCTAEHMVLFATDIAGRGLDFPSVDWVVQFDCPEDTAAYIHRVGRTARYTSAGRALLLLTPREAEGMKLAMSEAKIPIKSIKINPAKQQAIGPALQALLSKSTQLKEWAQRALIAYVRSVFLAPDKTVFDVASLPLDALAASWGLLAAPRMRFLKRVGGKKQVVAELGAGEDEEMGPGGASAAAMQDAASDDDGCDSDDGGGGASDSSDDEAQQQPKTSAQKSRRKAGDDELRGPGTGTGRVGTGDDGDDFLVVKQRDVFGSGKVPEALAAATEEAAANGAGGTTKKKKLKIKPGRGTGQRVVFGEDGEAMNPLEALAVGAELETGQQGEAVAADGEGVYVVADRPEQRFSLAAQVMKQRDQEDKARLKELRAQMKAERKARKRAAEAAEQDDEVMVTLGGRGGGSEDDEDNEGGMSESGSERQGRGGGSDGSYDMGSQSFSEDDDDGSDSDGEEEQEALPRVAGKRGRNVTQPSRQPQQAKKARTLAEQEAEALARIMASRR